MHQNHDRLVGEQQRKTFNAQVVAAIEAAERPGSAAENMVPEYLLQLLRNLLTPAGRKLTEFPVFR